MTDLQRPPLSLAQLEALADPSDRILVAAGAGSGKTRLLVAYFVQAVLEEGVSLENVAAVTFTRKAGSELAERIRRDLETRGHADLARNIDRAIIGTIHGLCSRLLREQPLQADIDPNFAIIEDDVASLVREEVSKAVWDRVIESATDDELEAIASRGDRLRKQAVAMYVRLRGMGRDIPQFNIESESNEPASRLALEAACLEAIAGVRQDCRTGASLDEDLERVGDCLQWLDQMATGAERPVVAATNGFFPSKRSKSAEPWFQPVRQALIEYRCALAGQELGPVVAVVNRLLAFFHREYEDYKDAHGVLDFADLELRTTAMLPKDSPRGPGIGAGSVLGRVGSSSRILVDEFQDTNEVQCAILDRLGADRVVMVGDERQSIYGFRGADVDVFRRSKEAKGLSHHRLDTNYRSRPEILAFINRLFSAVGFFGAGEFDLLMPGRDLQSDPPVGRDPKAQPAAPGPWITEVLVAERPVSAEGQEEAPVFHEAEARAVAARIRRLIDEEEFAQGDIVVLLPVLSNVNLYQKALLAQGIDIYVVRGKGYYSQEEVADVAALLRVLLNPHDDMSLLTVLRSPMVGVSDDCLFLLGRGAYQARAADGARVRPRSLWGVIRDRGVAAPAADPAADRAGDLADDDAERLAAFTQRLGALRTRVGRPGLSELIDDAVSMCDYDLCLLTAPEGKRRFANIRKLMRMAADYEALEGPDLAGFVDLIGSLNELGDAEGNAPSLAEGEDVVRVMTVHQAKGLEFPAVFLAGLGSPGHGSAVDEFVVGHDGRMAAVVKQRQNNYEESHPHWGPAPDIIADEQRRDDEEDTRLLYVAMTRAADRLFLVGARPKGDKMGGAPIGRIVAALGLGSFPGAGSVVELDEVGAAVVGVSYARDETSDPERAGAGLPSGSCLSEWAPEPPCFLQLESPAAIPRQISFSALSAYDRCPCRFYLERVLGVGTLPGAVSADGDRDTAAPPDFLLDDEESDTGLEVGLLVHSLLERIDLTRGKPAPDAVYELACSEARSAGLTLSERGIRRGADLVAAFWGSPLVGDSGIAWALREQEFSFVHGGITVHGVMDLLIRSEERWHIVDYKSNRLGSRTPKEAAEAYALQAEVYSLAALKAGAPAVRMEFLFLEAPEDPVVIDYGPGDRRPLEDRLDQALAGIRLGTFPPAVGVICADCGVADLCGSMAASRADGIE